MKFAHSVNLRTDCPSSREVYEEVKKTFKFLNNQSNALCDAIISPVVDMLFLAQYNALVNCL